MASAQIASVLTVSGLYVAPTLDDMKCSALRWNGLLESMEQPEVIEKHCNEIADILERYGMVNKFGVHLVYRYDAVENGEVMVKTKLEIMTGSWSRATDVMHLELSNIRGCIFKLNSDGCLEPYEFSVGHPAEMLDIDSAFLLELCGYLLDNQLNDLLGLEVIETTDDLVEFDLSYNGMVKLKRDQAEYSKLFKLTGFIYSKGEDGVRQLKGNSTHAETTTPRVYKVFIDGKLNNEASLMEALVTLGLISNK